MPGAQGGRLGDDGDELLSHRNSEVGVVGAKEFNNQWEEVE